MLLNKKKYKFALRLLEHWESEKMLLPEEAENLKNSIGLSLFDWKKLAKYSFWFAGISIAIAVFALFMDEVIIALIMQFLKLPYSVRAVLSAIAASAFYIWGFYRKKSDLKRQLSSEFLLFTGAVFTALTAYLFVGTFNLTQDQYPFAVLFSAVVYLCTGYFAPSGFMWMTGLSAFSLWFGAETGYISGWGAYFLGMNFPVRFFMLGIVIAGISFFMDKGNFSPLRRTTYIFSLLYIFISLWILSIYGNYGGSDYREVTKLELTLWSLLFGAVALSAIIYGLRKDDAPSRGFGLTFIFINLYTKYFEYFWKSTHKAVFFALLGLSFWLLGRYSEKAWNKIKNRLLESSDDQL